MKYIFTISLLFILCYNLADAQQTPTYADPPGPEHVLVVYKEPTSPTDTLGLISRDSVKYYYQQRREIPEINIWGLPRLVDTLVYDPETQTTHQIELDQQGEIIRDMNNKDIPDPTIHAWLYFNERIAKPIANYLKTTYVNGTPLKDIIRFIVLVKGVPFRIDAREEDADSRGQNVIVANLLTLLGETIADPNALLFYYNKNVGIPNPYYNVDPNFSMDHNFLPNYYQKTVSIGGQIKSISLSYLVTHLSAPRYSDIKRMIDSSVAAINATDYEWFIDQDPTPCRGWSIIEDTETIFQSLGITNYFIDNTDTVFVTNPSNKNVMSYSSNGTWTSIGPGCNTIAFSPNYVQTLGFTYAAGAVFNTLESHTGLSIGTYPVIRTRGQGLIADFTLMGGTVAVGQAFHSPATYEIKNNINFTHYAAGYTFIEAAYQGMQNTNASNVIVGDPLTRIATPRSTITLTQNTTLAGGDYYDRIIVPEGITLTIPQDTTVNFRRNASLQIDGTLEIENEAVLNF